MMRRVFATGVVVAASLLPGLVSAQGTKLWSVERYEELAKGSAEGVAIRSDGVLEAGPATSLLFATGGSYVWSLASDGAGNAYVGTGGNVAGSATVMRVGPDGKATKVFEGKELGVQSLRVLPDGALLVATSPDGKVYRVATDAKKSGAAGTVIFDPEKTEEHPKYIWDVAVVGQSLFVATGAPAVVYRVEVGASSPAGAKVLFKTADQHIRCLLATSDGTLWAGSDGAGVIYRIAVLQKDAKPFAVYAAGRKEITALATDAAGNVYAAGVGNKGPGALPPLPVTGNVGVTITFSQPGSATAAGGNTLVPDGSEIYRIGADGAPSKLVTLKDDVVYGLAFRSGSLLAATGNRGRVYRVDTTVAGRFTDLAHLEAAQGMAFAAEAGGLLVGTSNSGKVFRLSDTVAKDATYTSEVFDAQGFAQWGRAEVRPQSLKGVEMYARSGNVPSSLMGWSEWAPMGADGAVSVPAARFVQWKAVLRAGAELDRVGLNYLPKNASPVVDEVVVQAGARMPAGGGMGQSNTVQIAFPASAGAVPALTFGGDANTAPLTAQKDKTAITTRWLAHDENGDDLMFAVWYRGLGESNWRLLKDKISDKYYSFDSALLPDGPYVLKVVASDAPVHADADAMTGEKMSAEFVVDTTPPVPGALVAEMVPGSAAKIHARFDARDAVSPIAHAEYSVDAGPWQYVEPVGKVSDSLAERYDFVAPLTNATGAVTDTKEHVIAMRVFDRFENVVTVKAVVK
jgi:WD40 repeat protein